jgi:hypothetical protein
MKSSTSSSGKAAPKYRAKGLKNRAGINAYAKSNAARKSDAGLVNRAGMAKSKRGQVMSERQRNWDVKGMKSASKMGIYKDAITKANAIKNAKKGDAGLANRVGMAKSAAAKKTAAANKTLAAARGLKTARKARKATAPIGKRMALGARNQSAGARRARKAGM